MATSNDYIASIIDQANTIRLELEKDPTLDESAAINQQLADIDSDLDDLVSNLVDIAKEG